MHGLDETKDDSERQKFEHFQAADGRRERMNDENEMLLGETEHPEGILDDSILSDEEREAMDMRTED